MIALRLHCGTGDGTTSSLEITFIQHEEGRFRPNGIEMIYEYILTDHLGNTRITFGDSDADGLADILQENHYYPFGMAMTMSSTLAAAPPNNYLYNGKELQDELDLGWYDYGARMYDASIGRWNGVDALAEVYASISPFVYVQNNPISAIDPNGNEVVWINWRGNLSSFISAMYPSSQPHISPFQNNPDLVYKQGKYVEAKQTDRVGDVSGDGTIFRKRADAVGFYGG